MVSSDFGKLDVSRHLTSGLDAPIGGFAIAARASPAPAAPRNCRRFISIQLQLFLNVTVRIDGIVLGKTAKTVPRQCDPRSWLQDAHASNADIASTRASTPI